MLTSHFTVQKRYTLIFLSILISISSTFQQEGTRNHILRIGVLGPYSSQACLRVLSSYRAVFLARLSKDVFHVLKGRLEECGEFFRLSSRMNLVLRRRRDNLFQ